MKVICSVCILTYNSAKTLERCLGSVKDFSDIVILDGGSIDGTLEIAQEFGARVFPQENDSGSDKISDFTEARKKLFNLALEDWRLWLDSDEWLSDEVRDKIENIVIGGGDTNKLYSFVRKAVIGGKVIDKIYYYPEYCKRLFNKNSDIRLKDQKIVHEDLVPGKKSKVEKIEAVIFHAWQDNYRELIKKDEYYLNLAVKGKYMAPFLRRTRIFFINLLKAMKVLSKSFYIYARYGFKKTLPVPYSWRFVRYHLLYAKKIFFIVPSIKELKLICKKASKPTEWQLVHWGERLNRKMTIYLTWIFLHFSIAPNQITVLGTIVTLIGFSMLIFNDLIVQIVGVAMIFFSFLIDGVDGEVARYRRAKDIATDDGELGGVYVEPMSHDVQYSFMFLPIGIGSTLASGSSIPLIAAFLATVGKLLFRLAECRYDAYERNIVGRSVVNQELLETGRKKPRATFFYFLYRHIFTSSMTVYTLAMAVTLRHVEWFLYFYAIGFIGLWLFKVWQQKKRIKGIIQGL